MFLVIDNYDSFTYNLVQYLGELGVALSVVRNDRITPAQVRALAPQGLVISPGPGHPAQAGVCLELVQTLGPELPILGVCLGHQCLGAVYGGRVVRAETLMHGKTSPIHHQGQGVFRGLPGPFTATRYHSLVIERATCPQVLAVTAWTADGTIMGVQHRDFPWVQGVQFHPESILTESGRQLLQNFVDQCGDLHAAA
ncbi:aminodeoxychorismate/anthranilate synthase component II [Candidatus Cyanaurora vandensis]|uniref:anthranilate synthase component II n=1 Tax=Candidatus Cyanaurora vandensis TaxID=2714958 RepID=UPI00257F8F0C|nr:aminodeoxychorismate/anthranilate synthase component II [Candidatus Cyanaurora vandensis]